jgi:hypothetical protein
MFGANRNLISKLIVAKAEADGMSARSLDWRKRRAAEALELCKKKKAQAQEKSRKEKVKMDRNMGILFGRGQQLFPSSIDANGMSPSPGAKKVWWC